MNLIQQLEQEIAKTEAEGKDVLLFDLKLLKGFMQKLKSTEEENTKMRETIGQQTEEIEKLQKSNDSMLEDLSIYRFGKG